MSPGETAYAKWCARTGRWLEGTGLAREVSRLQPWAKLSVAQRETWTTIAVAVIESQKATTYETARSLSSHVSLELPEEDRQLVLMALAHLSLKRPGWDYALNLIARRIDNVLEDRAVLYDQLRRMSAEEKEAED